MKIEKGDKFWFSLLGPEEVAGLQCEVIDFSFDGYPVVKIDGTRFKRLTVCSLDLLLDWKPASMGILV